jgi:hypothetical protein
MFTMIIVTKSKIHGRRRWRPYKAPQFLLDISMVILQSAAYVSLSIMVVIALYCGRSYMDEVASDFKPLRENQVLTAEQLSTGFKRVEIQSAAVHGKLVGTYKSPSSHHGSVLFLHGSGGHRGLLMTEALLLSEQGLGVLLLDLPGHGESDGKVTWGDPEIQAVEESLAWMAAQRHAGPLGIYAFSMSTMTALQVATKSPQKIRGLVLAGAFPTIFEAFTAQAGSAGILHTGSWYVAARMMGISRSDEQPIVKVKELRNMPVLFIMGTSDRAIPAYLTDSLYDAANAPKTRWVVSGATHGAYATMEPHLWAEIVGAFFIKMRAQP